MKVLIIDNYDSFVYNLAYIVRLNGIEPTVVRNDKVSFGKIASYDKILLSPGPGIPDEAGMMKEILHTFADSKSFLGVCLGHQAIGEVFGGKLKNLEEVLHGVTTEISKTAVQSPLFAGLPEKFRACHYHSWVIEENTLPSCLSVTAYNEAGLIMGIQHKDLSIFGVQFHPESYASQFGKLIIENWLKA